MEQSVTSQNPIVLHTQNESNVYHLIGKGSSSGGKQSPMGICHQEQLMKSFSGVKSVLSQSSIEKQKQLRLKIDSKQNASSSQKICHTNDKNKQFSSSSVQNSCLTEPAFLSKNTSSLKKQGQQYGKMPVNGIHPSQRLNTDSNIYVSDSIVAQSDSFFNNLKQNAPMDKALLRIKPYHQQNQLSSHLKSQLSLINEESSKRINTEPVGYKKSPSKMAHDAYSNQLKNNTLQNSVQFMKRARDYQQKPSTRLSGNSISKFS